MLRSVYIFLLMSLSVHTVFADEYLGTKMLEILGVDKSGEAFTKFQSQYALDRALKNPDLGIKLTASHDSISIITAITLTSSGYEVNDIKYKQFSSTLPFSISFSDDASELERKWGPGKGSDEDVKMKYKKDGITIKVYFKTSEKKNITYIKFTQNIGLVGPYRIEGNHDASAVTAVEETSIETAKKETKSSVIKTTNKSGQYVAHISATGKRKSSDPFYNAIMNVIESGEEEMFVDIKKDAMAMPNFWNYKYTYSTSVTIPGEKYNMLYSFPFRNSQLDFVSVLEETDGDSPLIGEKYTETEAKLKEYFKPSEGWTYSYTINSEAPNGIKDLELKNSKLGSIVLDYSISPYGKHVLYLRFLLQYT